MNGTSHSSPGPDTLVSGSPEPDACFLETLDIVSSNCSLGGSSVHGDDEEEMNFYDSDSSSSNEIPIADLEHNNPSEVDDQEEMPLDQSMFEPLYEGANITICGTYCAIMEYKRACRLPFTAIEKLLDLLALVCPANNGLPNSLYILKSFFKSRSCPVSKQKFCPECSLEIASDKAKCTTPGCQRKDVNYLYTLRPERQIRNIVKRKST